MEIGDRKGVYHLTDVNTSLKKQIHALLEEDDLTDYTYSSELAIPVYELLDFA